jgi:hypothetical protein
MLNDLLLVVVILALLVFGAVNLKSLGKNCKSWTILTDAKVVRSKKWQILYAVVCFTIPISLLYLAKVATGRLSFRLSDFIFIALIFVITIFSIWNFSKAKVAKEGIILGRFWKTCIPWKSLKSVEIRGSTVVANRLILEVERADRLNEIAIDLHS